MKRSSDKFRSVSGVCASNYDRFRLNDNFYPSEPRDSFMLTRYNIEPGQVVKISSKDFDDQWSGGPQFSTLHCIYVGSANLWLLRKGSQINTIMPVMVDTPLDTYRPPAPTFVNWPTFNCAVHHMELMVENRGKEIGHFVARLAGSFRA